jgi:Zn-dependent peptidase ImmA (M78 family)
VPRAVGPHRAERAANDLLCRYSVSRPPVDPVAIAQKEGLVIVYERLPNDTSSVLLREPSGRRLIGVNSRHPMTRQRFSAAHELGHAMLHFDAAPPATSEAVVSRPLEVLFRDRLAGQGTDKVEIDANVFAASLLMPANLVTAALRGALDSYPKRSMNRVVLELASLFGISEQALRYRLINLNLIDPA